MRIRLLEKGETLRRETKRECCDFCNISR